MTEQEIRQILEKQHRLFQEGATLPVSFRLSQLQKLKDGIRRYEEKLDQALEADLGKSRMESYMCEIGLTLSELTWMQKHLRSLVREKEWQHLLRSLQQGAFGHLRLMVRC